MEISFGYATNDIARVTARNLSGEAPPRVLAVAVSTELLEIASSACGLLAMTDRECHL
jgi:hypothetical protein